MVFVDRISVTTPERVVVEHDVAGVGSRALAQLVDGVILLVGYVLLFLLVYGLQSWLPQWLLVAVAIVLFASLPLAYYILFEWRRGTTPGKQVLRIRVVTEYGAPIGLRESATRNIMRVVDFLPLLYVVGGVVAACSSRSQRLGDMAAGTVAVRVPKPLPGRAQAARTRGSFVDMVAHQPSAADVAPAEITSVTAEYLRRRAKLGSQARADLAKRLAVRLEAYVSRPDGLTDEQFVEYAETRLKT